MPKKRPFFGHRETIPLSAREEKQLLARLAANPTPEDKARLITSNLRFVIAIATRYRGYGLPLEDLINEGSLGLIEAVARYDPGRGTRFLTYAKWWIRKAILQSLSEGTIIRITPYRRRKIKDARRSEEDSLTAPSIEPRKSEPVEDRIAHTVADLNELLAKTPREVYIQDRQGDETDRPADDLMLDRNAVNPESQVLQEEKDQLLHWAMGILTQTEWHVISERYGLESDHPRTLNEIAITLGVSRERIRQIELESKEKIRVVLVHRLRSPSRRSPTATPPQKRERHSRGRPPVPKAGRRK